MNCPQCGNPMQDQRATKLGKQPDFVCLSGCVNEKGFPQGVWLKAPRPIVKQAGGPGMPQQSNIREPKWTWAQLSQVYQQSMIVARKSVVGMGAALKVEWTMADLLSATATIFICATRDGVQQPPVREPELEEAEAGQG